MFPGMTDRGEAGDVEPFDRPGQRRLHGIGVGQVDVVDVDAFLGEQGRELAHRVLGEPGLPGHLRVHREWVGAASRRVGHLRILAAGGGAARAYVVLDPMEHRAHRLGTMRGVGDKAGSTKGDPLKVGERSTVSIASRSRWNDTGVPLQRGANYLLTATGEWVDWKNRSGPDGYSSNNIVLRLAEWARREPSKPWFALIGALARDKSNQFLIGDRCEYQPATTGELTCFANDVALGYINNKGHVSLTIERTA